MPSFHLKLQEYSNLFQYILGHFLQSMSFEGKIMVYSQKILLLLGHFLWLQLLNTKGILLLISFD